MHPAPPPDAETLVALRRGDERAFERLFRTHYAPLCGYAHTFLKDDADGEEVVQTVFLTLWEKRETLDIAVSLKAYLYRAVHNHCLNRLKHLRVRDEHAGYVLATAETGFDSATAQLIGGELEARVEAAIAQLPAQCQLIFRMSRFEELRYQEIADQLNLSVKTVENQIGKALKLLRAELAEYLPLLTLMNWRLVELLTKSPEIHATIQQVKTQPFNL